MHWHSILAASIGISLTVGFIILMVIFIRRPDPDIERMKREAANITAIFNSLPRPKDEIPTTIRKRTK